MTETSAAAATLEPAFVERIATAVGCRPDQVRATADLLADGATVPFIARYRKEATRGLDDEQVENVAKQRDYFCELAARRDAILESIREQDKLTPELEAAIRAAVSKQELEDLYLPYKKKRRTRAQKAREAGLEPLADLLWAAALAADRSVEPAAAAAAYVDAERGVADAPAALAGASDIVAERIAETAAHRVRLRGVLADSSTLRSKAVKKRREEPDAAVYRDWFEHAEPSRRVASHRLLAILRGEKAGFLRTELAIDDDAEVARLRRAAPANDTPAGRFVGEAVADGYARLLRPSVESEVRAAMRDRAFEEAVSVFRANLEALLMQAPLGLVSVVGIDPGYRTGCKVVAVDGTGKILATSVIYPTGPKTDEAGSATVLVGLVRDHGARAVAVGNGTGGREAAAFARQALRAAELPEVTVAIVPETGASVYSASAVAREELPDLDVSIRGAVSIARRLQDPLAELVKIDPKSLGVGQYQHDVDQKMLAAELDAAVIAVVNRVGVELNTASPSLLARVSGLSARLAKAIVAARDAKGRFGSRRDLLGVSGLGPRTFEQAAGFLRVRDAENPLDRTGVHPERYDLVGAMAAALSVSVAELVGHPEVVARIEVDRFADEAAGVGRFTLDDIRTELERPGRDPRPDFAVPEWNDAVTSIEDLNEGMVVEGRVSNVTNFGAFVDVGVKRDGLVHVSQLSHRFVSDPREVVKVGDVVKVKVTEVDHERARIGLSIKALTDPPADARSRHGGGGGGDRSRDRDRGRDRAQGGGGGGRGPRRGQGRPAASRGPNPAPPPAPAKPREPERLHTMDDLLKKYGRKGER